MLLALVNTGYRASEFVFLNLDDLNLSTGAVLIRKAKGHKWRTVFLGAKSRRELARRLRHREHEGPLWVTVQGTRLRNAGLRQIVRHRGSRRESRFRHCTVSAVPWP